MLEIAIGDFLAWKMREVMYSIAENYRESTKKIKDDCSNKGDHFYWLMCSGKHIYQLLDGYENRKNHGEVEGLSSLALCLFLLFFTVMMFAKCNKKGRIK